MQAKVSITRLDELDALKGILITLIVLGHNYYFSGYFSVGFATLYNFHVACFLLLPFLFYYKSYSLPRIKDRVTRILVPHYIFFFVALCAYAIFILDTTDQDIGEWVKAVIFSIILANETFFDIATGFRHFWFLPALMSLFLVLLALDKSSIELRKWIILFFVVWHCLIGLVDRSYYPLMPWGAALVGYLVLPGVVVQIIREKIPWNLWTNILVIGVWLVLVTISMRFGLFIGLAGDPDGLPTILQPEKLIFHDALLVSTFFVIWRIALWLRNSIFRSLGSHSLQIFLIHPFVWQAYWMFGGQHVLGNSMSTQLILVLVTLTGTIFISYILSRMIERTLLQRIMFPRSINSWRASMQAITANK